MSLSTKNRECQIYCRWQWQPDKQKFKLIFAHDPDMHSYIRYEYDDLDGFIADEGIRDYFSILVSCAQKFVKEGGGLNIKLKTWVDIREEHLKFNENFHRDLILGFCLGYACASQQMKPTIMPRIDERAWEWIIEAFTYNLNYFWDLNQKLEFKELVGKRYHNLKDIITSSWFKLAPRDFIK